MSTAWYRSGFVPKLIREWKAHNNSTATSNNVVQVWETTCIVTNFAAASQCNILINPANPNLSGVSKFPYFPKGGPEPKSMPTKDSHPIMGYVTQWGGMEVGQGMMFAANVVDGLVHQLGGRALAHECQQALSTRNKNDNNVGVIQEGNSIVTGPGSDELRQHYQYIIHTVPPFYSADKKIQLSTRNSDRDRALLASCYQTSLEEAISLQSNDNYNTSNSDDCTIRLACPLLGAGCRGFPQDEAIQAAARAAANLLESKQLEDTGEDTHNFNSKYDITLAFAIPNGEIRQQLVTEIDQQVSMKQ